MRGLTSGSPGASAAVTPAEAAARAQGDCLRLGHVASDLTYLDAAGSGFDYQSDTKLIDGYTAEGAPKSVTDSIKRVRDLMDTFASAAQKVGLASGDDPLPDQIDEISKAFHFSSSDQAANARAIQTVNTWVDNGCKS